jgi:hypothetical protein
MSNNRQTINGLITAMNGVYDMMDDIKSSDLNDTESYRTYRGHMQQMIHLTMSARDDLLSGALTDDEAAVLHTYMTMRRFVALRNGDFEKKEGFIEFQYITAENLMAGNVLVDWQEFVYASNDFVALYEKYSWSLQAGLAVHLPRSDLRGYFRYGEGDN